jgi:hypothetical protein
MTIISEYYTLNASEPGAASTLSRFGISCEIPAGLNRTVAC